MFGFTENNKAVYYIKLLSILAKRSIFDFWMGQECASTAAYNTVFKVQMKIPPRQQVKTGTIVINSLYLKLGWKLIVKA